MSNSDMCDRLNKIADSLGPVAGTLMSLACRDDFIHEESCNCSTCRAFLATHAAMNSLEEIIKEITAWAMPSD